jgi:hypothetical protein
MYRGSVVQKAHSQPETSPRNAEVVQSFSAAFRMLCQTNRSIGDLCLNASPYAFVK